MAIELVTGHADTPHVSGDDVGAFQAGICGTDSYVLGELPTVTMVDANTLTITACELLIEGRHVRLTGTTSVSIQSGGQGTKRNDLVYVEYAYSTQTGIETAEIKVVQGTPSSEAVDPALPNPASILDGATIADVAIARVSIDNLTPEAEWLLPTLPSIEGLQTSVKALQDSVSPSCYSHAANGAYVSIFKIGRLVYIDFGYSGNAVASGVALATVPAEYRPSSSINVYAIGWTSGNVVNTIGVNVNGNGDIYHTSVTPRTVLNGSACWLMHS